MKKLFKFIGKSFLVLTGIVILLLGMLWAGFHLFLQPAPSVSEVKIQNEEFCLGHACRTQPKTLEQYVKQASTQLGEFYAHRLEFWPRDVYKDNVVYFVSGDKQQAWKTDMPTGTYTQIAPGEVPEIEHTIGYPDEFLPLLPEQVGQSAFVQVIHLRELLDEKAFENFVYLGTYDKILSYIHEGFHAYGQSGDSWDARNQLIGNRSRSEYFENSVARAWRVQLLDVLWQALANEQERETLLRQAVATYHAYNERFPEEAKMAHYMDRVEGTARYIEVAAALRTSYPEVKNIADQVAAYGFLVSQQNPEKEAGVVSEGYELGVSAGMVLDVIDEKPVLWKEEFLADAEKTPMSILASRFPDVDASTAVAPSEKRLANMENPPTRPRNYKAILTILYEIVF